MLIPYTGITGFRTIEEVSELATFFKANRPQGSKRKLHVGAMMSFKTLHGLPTKWRNIFPKSGELVDIFDLQEDHIYNCLHYADYDMTRPRYNHWLEIAKAIDHTGRFINAIQLDMIWPDPSQIAGAILSARKNIEVILQIGQIAFDEIENNPDILVDRLGNYQDVIHRVLLDKSMGQGKRMDAQGLLPFARLIRMRFPNLGIVVAGGLGPAMTHLIAPFVKDFPDISLDAQTRVCVDQNPEGRLDLERCKDYILESFALP